MNVLHISTPSSPTMKKQTTLYSSARFRALGREREGRLGKRSFPRHNTKARYSLSLSSFSGGVGREKRRKEGAQCDFHASYFELRQNILFSAFPVITHQTWGEWRRKCFSSFWHGEKGVQSK
jgi:hypothetical protein